MATGRLIRDLNITGDGGKPNNETDVRKKTRQSKKKLKNICDLDPAKKDRNWPIKATVLYPEHPISKCGKHTSKKGCVYFKCVLDDGSGCKIEAVAFGKVLAETFHKHFTENKTIIIEKATLENVNDDYRFICNHPYQISIDKYIKWSPEKNPKQRARSDGAVTRAKVRKMDDTLSSGDGSDGAVTRAKVRKMDDTLSSGDARKGGKLRQIFRDLSRDLIHQEWKFFFRYLFENADVYINEAVINNPGNVREQIHTLLVDWVEREKKAATCERVKDALKEEGREDLIEKYFHV